MNIYNRPSESNNFSIFQATEDRCNTMIDNTDPVRTTHIINDHWNFGRMAIIDEFVQKLLGTDKPGYVGLQSGNNRTYWHCEDWVKPYFRDVTGAISPYMAEKFDIRNVHVELFLKACHELKIDDWMYRTATAPGAWEYANATTFNQLIETIRRLARKQPYASTLWHHHNDWKANRKSCYEYVDGLFLKRSRYTVIRLDLGYLEEFGYDVFTKDFNADVTRFIENMQRAKYLKRDCLKKRLFADLAGYIWKLEYGTDRLLHFHILLFFTQKDPRKAVYWAQEIGMYWKETITCGRGWFNNTNKCWKDKPGEGIGEVNRNDTVKRRNLSVALDYLFKQDQCLLIRKSDRNLRTFGKGEL